MMMLRGLQARLRPLGALRALPALPAALPAVAVGNGGRSRQVAAVAGAGRQALVVLGLSCCTALGVSGLRGQAGHCARGLHVSTAFAAAGEEGGAGRETETETGAPRSLAASVRADEVLDYWFDSATKEERQKRWFMGGPEVDQEIRDRFGDLVAAAKEGRLEDWESSPMSALALVILLDQFTRNVYRKQAEAFDGDALALRVAKKCIDQYSFLYSPVQKVFLYMPLEHSEDLRDQELCVELFRALKRATLNTANEQTVSGFADFAVKHMRIIQQFGRFPHRNAVLGRENTPEEEEYLNGGGARFGQ